MSMVDNVWIRRCLVENWAPWRIALAGAARLDPAFHRAVKDAFLRIREEERDSERKVNRSLSLDTWKSRGKGPEWVRELLQRLTFRRALVQELAESGFAKTWQANSEATISDTGIWRSVA